MTWSRAIIALVFALTADTASACYRTGGCAHYDYVPGSAEQAFRDGKYILAASIAEADGSAVALAFAARARIADAITRGDGLCLDCLVRAEAIAHGAIEAGTSMPGDGFTDGADYLAHRPALAQGYIQLAIAIGFRGRLLDSFEAQSEGLAEKGRAAIDRALELDPSNSWARASLGGWHLEIVHRAGPVLASMLYGASEEEGLRNFRAALGEDPNSLLLHYHYALSILALDAEKFRTEALSTLEAGNRDPHSDAMLAFTRKRADKLIEALKAGDLDEIAALVHRYQGYPASPSDAAAH